MRNPRRSSVARSSSVCSPILIGLLFLVGGPSTAQEPAPARPGPEHALLATRAGTWNGTAHFRMLPDGPVAVSKATETRRMGAGGFWLIYDYQGELAGQPFEGHGTTGYDQTQKKYVGHWVDSMSSSLSVQSGRYDEKTRTFTFESSMIEPQTGEKLVYRLEQVIEDDDHDVTSIFMKGPDGKEFESLRIEYTRKGAPERRKPDPLAEIVGTWSMQIKYQEDGDALDYDLRIAKEGGGLQAAVISPRSGEHKCKSAEWKKGTLRLGIIREYDGNEVELEYEAKLSKDGLSGTVTFVGVDGFSGTWTATKKK